MKIKNLLYVVASAFILASCGSDGDTPEKEEMSVSHVQSLFNSVVQADNRLYDSVYDIDQDIVDGKDKFALDLSLTSAKTWANMSLKDLEEDKKSNGPFYESSIKLMKHYKKGVEESLPNFINDLYGEKDTEKSAAEYNQFFDDLEKMREELIKTQESEAKKYNITLY